MRLLNRLRGAWMAWKASANEMGEPVWNGQGFIATLNTRSRHLELLDAGRDVEFGLDAGEPCRHTSEALLEIMPDRPPARARRALRIDALRPRK